MVVVIVGLRTRLANVVFSQQDKTKRGADGIKAEQDEKDEGGKRQAKPTSRKAGEHKSEA